MKHSAKIISLSILFLALGTLSCSKDTRCGKKLDGTWKLNQESSKFWVDGVLTEDTTETDIQLENTFSWWSDGGGHMQTELAQTIPTPLTYSIGYEYEFSEKCEIFSWSGNPNGGWIDANVQKLTSIQFIYDFEVEMGTSLWEYEYSFTKQE